MEQQSSKDTGTDLDFEKHLTEAKRIKRILGRISINSPQPANINCDVHSYILHLHHLVQDPPQGHYINERMSGYIGQQFREVFSSFLLSTNHDLQYIVDIHWHYLQGGIDSLADSQKEVLRSLLDLSEYILTPPGFK